MIEDNHSKGNRIMEEIIDKEIDKESKVFYKVKWKDMDVSLSTWEPIELLDDIEILQAYENKRKELNSELNEIEIQKEPQELGMKQKSIIDDDSNQRREAENDDDDDDEVIDINHTNANLTDKEMIKEEEDNNENYDNNKNTDNDCGNHDEPHIEKMLTQRKRKRDSIKKPLSISKSKSLSYSNPKSLQKGNLFIDIPLTIKTAKQNPKNPKQILCEIIWKSRPNGMQLLNTWYSNKRLKSFYPLLLLEYYENHRSFPNKK